MRFLKLFNASLLAIVMLFALSFSANAILNPPTNLYGWVSTPNNTTDTALQSYYISIYNAPNVYLDIWFYNSTEHLAFIRKQFVQGDPKYGKQQWNMYSNKTKIGYSYYRTDGQIGNKFMCPDGHSTTVKRHIGILTQTFPRWIYLPIDTGTNIGKPCGYTAPANQTDITTIQLMYGPDYTVERMYPNEDLFRVRCTAIPACEVYDGITPKLTYGVEYLSNTQRIAYRWYRWESEYQFVAVRTKDTVTNQTAKDDIDLLVASGIDGNPWSWVDYTWNPKFTSWFN